MGKMLRIISVVGLSLLLVASVSLVGCGGEGELEDLVAPDMELSQYLKGTTVDFDEATLVSLATGGGEPGWKSGTAAAMYPTYHFSAAARDATAKAMYPNYRGYDTADVNFALLGAAEQGNVDGAILASLDPAELAAVDTAVVGFIDRIDIDMSDAVLPTETSAYAILSGVSATQADGWVTDVADGMDLADRFYVRLVKEAVVAYHAYGVFDDIYLLLYGEVPAAPTDAQVEGVARVAGETFFTSGTASATYPVQADEQAQALYGISYAECDEMQAGYVDAAVYAGLPAAEKGYIDYGAVPGLFASVGAQLTDALPLTQNIAYLTLYYNVSPAAADGWAADVGAGMHPRQAFYKWLAYEAVAGSAGMAGFIQLSVAEFSIKVTNPNEYWISLDSLSVNTSMDVDFYGMVYTVDVAKAAMGDKIWVPPMEDDVEGEITVHLAMPVKTMDNVTWGVMAGLDGGLAFGLALSAFGAIQAGTAEFDVTIDATVSAETGTITESYALTWTPPAE